jgi:hypothetical protein
VPPGVELDPCRTSRAETQSAPGALVRLGDGLGDGDGDGLGLAVVPLGLGLWVAPRLVESVGVGLGLVEGLVVSAGLALSVGLALEMLTLDSSRADTTCAAPPDPHGELGWTWDASAGVSPRPVSRKDPPVSSAATRPARMNPGGNAALRPSNRPEPDPPLTLTLSMPKVGNPICQRYRPRRELAADARYAELSGRAGADLRLIMI